MRDKKNLAKWTKENVKGIVGVRVIQPIRVLTEDFLTMYVTPNDFFYHKKAIDPYTLWPTNFKYHIPRSLVRRARIQVNIKTNQIVGTSAMQSANKRIR